MDILAGILAFTVFLSPFILALCILLWRTRPAALREREIQKAQRKMRVGEAQASMINEAYRREYGDY